MARQCKDYLWIFERIKQASSRFELLFRHRREGKSIIFRGVPFDYFAESFLRFCFGFDMRCQQDPIIPWALACLVPVGSLLLITCLLLWLMTIRHVETKVDLAYLKSEIYCGFSSGYFVNFLRPFNFLRLLSYKVTQTFLDAVCYDVIKARFG